MFLKIYQCDIIKMSHTFSIRYNRNYSSPTKIPALKLKNIEYLNERYYISNLYHQKKELHFLFSVISSTSKKVNDENFARLVTIQKKTSGRSKNEQLHKLLPFSSRNSDYYEQQQYYLRIDGNLFTVVTR